jgi:hypothetical protein
MSGRDREQAAGGGVGLAGLVRGVGRLMDLVARMAEHGQEEYSRRGQVEGLGGGVRGV